eukprot:m51a1_g2974 hypothetical protein (176) ;mRNA; f:706697-708346
MGLGGRRVRAAPSVLAGVLCACAVVLSVRGQCDQGEQWDNGVSIEESVTYLKRNQIPCPGSTNPTSVPRASSQDALMMMFTPPKIPWRYTRFCWELQGHPTWVETDVVTGYIGLYSSKVGKEIVWPASRMGMLPWSFNFTSGPGANAANGTNPKWHSLNATSTENALMDLQSRLL